MKSPTRIMIIFLAVVTLAAFNMTSASFAKSGAGSDRGGDRSGGHGDSGGRGDSHGGDGAGDRGDSGSSDATDRGTRAGDHQENTRDQGDENGTRERHAFRGSGDGHRGGKMGELTAEDMTERAQDRAESLLDRLDTDDDGVINADELAAASDERAQSIYDRLADRFGELEGGGIEIDPESRMADRLGDIAGVDGVLTADELADSFSDRLSEFDENEDGSISGDELTVGMLENASERFNERDTNGDGVLNADDRNTGETEESDNQADPVLEAE